MRVRIIPNKRIGRVIFFVEGTKDEPGLLRHLFHHVLGYKTVIWDKRNQCIQEYTKPGDPYSKVFVVPMPTSSIKNIPGEEEFLDAIYQALKSYGLNKDEAFVYYLFDRDRKSNKPEAVEKKIKQLRNPLDNGSDLPGALLLSYPCVQAYYCHAYDDMTDFRNSQEAKKYVNVHGYKSLDEERLLLSAANTLLRLNSIRQKQWNDGELDDYSLINQDVYRFEEEFWLNNGHRYRTLSLLSLALLDLGIFELKEESCA